MSLGNLIRRNTAWIVGGSVGNRLLQFLVGIVLARLLVPEDFGLVVTIQIFTGAVGFLAGGGLGEALIQAKSVQSRDFNIVFSTQLLICILIFAGFYAISPFFADWFDEPRYRDLLWVSAISFLIRPFSNVPRAKLQRDMRFKAVSIIGFGTMIITSAASIVMAFYGMGPWALVLGGLVGGSVGAAFHMTAARWIPSLSFDPAVAKRLGGYGIRVTTNEIIVYARNQTSNLLVSSSLGAADVGLFNKAKSVQSLPTGLLVGPAYRTVFRALSSIQDNRDKSKYIYLRTITLLLTYTLPLMIGLYWLAEPFIVVLYGSNWQPAVEPLKILILAAPFICISNPAGAVCAAQDLLGREIRIQLQGWALLGLGAWAGLGYGIQGVAWGILPGLSYVYLRTVLLANSHLRVRATELMGAIKPAFVLGVFLIVVLFLSEQLAGERLKQAHPGFYLVTMTAIGGVAYALAFLYVPIPALVTEAGRWKVKLGLMKAPKSNP